MINSTIKKWGNSLALRIPKAYADELGLDENSEVSLEVRDDNLVISRGKPLEEMLSSITDENQHDLYDFGEARGKEAI